jgi:lysophospholipase L1-like esterase
MDCAIIGDSIAVGISHFRRDCYVDARSGRQAPQQQRVLNATNVLVISLGSNNGNALTDQELRRIRDSAVGNPIVYWILPNRPEHARTVVNRVAASYNDRVLDTRPVISTDQVHPTGRGYQILAEGTRR